MERRENFIKRIPFLLAAFILGVATFLAAFLPQTILEAKAERADVPYMTSSIEEDLSDLSELRYPANSWASHELVRFTEFYYTDDKDEEYRYGLYVYVYNPVEKEVAKENASVNMAITYNEKGEPEEYANFALQYVDHTSNHRFYKYYVKDSSKILNTARAYEQANGKRRYDVAGVQIMYKSGVDVKDEKVGLTYFFSGYGKYLGPGAEKESTLTCESRSLETVKLDVNSTYYRILKREEGDYEEYHQVSMVYFSVPEEYFTSYGGLQKIKSEWYEYVTKPIFVTSDKENYDDLYPWLGHNIGSGTEKCHCTVLWDDESKVVESGTWNSAYNASASYWGENNRYVLPQMDWLFYRADVEDNDDYYVTSDELIDYMNWYTNRFGGELVTGRYSKALFEDGIERDRLEYLTDPTSTCGHAVQEIDAGDTINLLEVEDLSWWEDIWDDPDYYERKIDPIVVIDAAKMRGFNKDTFANTYNINEHDAEAVYKAAVDATSMGERFVLFSFAVTDYYTIEACFDDNTAGGVSSADGFVAWETVFLNYDVISLTFRSELGVDTVIAAVSDPIDVVAGLDAPSNLGDDEGCGDIWSVISIILGLLIVVLIIIFWPYVGPIITAPFRFIRWIFRKGKEGRENRRRRKAEKLHAKTEKEKQKAAIERDKAALRQAKQARKNAKKNKKYKITYKGDKK